MRLTGSGGPSENRDVMALWEEMRLLSDSWRPIAFFKF
ncbi:hypothetical protein LP7551_03738 [Roseibium album]|nr:hypothetical protein LP7551_03738 [Roseibium album]